MVGLMIVNLILSLMSRLSDGQAIYQCKTKKELDEWRNGLKLQRLLVYKTTMYLVLESRIISFTAPYTQTNKRGQTQLISSLPFVHEHKEKERSKKVIGYLVFNDLTYELYKSKIANRLIAYQVNFDKDLANKQESNYLYLSSREAETAHFIFVFQRNPSYTLMFAYRNRTLNLFYHGKQERQLDFKDPPISNRTVNLPYRVKYAAFYRRVFDEEEDRKKNRNPAKYKKPNEHFLIELDEDQNLHVRLVSLPDVLREEKDVKPQGVASIGLSHFLSCHQPFENPSQVG